jgi:hypothetical protein
MVCWGRWVTLKDGRRVCIEDKSSKAVVGVAAFLIVSALASGSVVAATSVGGTAAESIAAQSIQTRVTNSRNAARRGQTSEAWRRMGLRVVTRAINREIRRELECTTPSYGQVRDFFLSTPCRSMQRTQPVLCDEQGNTIAVSTTWVRMPTVVSAERLKRLVDTDGTGSVSPITGEVPEARGVRFTGKHYASRRTGSLVVIAEAAPGSGQPDTEVLDGVAQVAAELPPP